MRALLALNPYFRRYWGRMALGILFTALSSLFQIFQPQVVREAFDLIGTSLAQRDQPLDQRHLDVPAEINSWIGWTGIDLDARLNGAATDEDRRTNVR
ncbi:MAG TPA: hypothetical protein PL002_10245, partial [Flavobacteriales bacterium]|nr:hypothetical protein [Flavobacteriales bacterium]